jgi:hypothetical protein
MPGRRGFLVNYATTIEFMQYIAENQKLILRMSLHIMSQAFVKIQFVAAVDILT